MVCTHPELALVPVLAKRRHAQRVLELGLERRGCACGVLVGGGLEPRLGGDLELLEVLGALIALRVELLERVEGLG